MYDFIQQNQDTITAAVFVLGPIVLGSIVGVLGASREGSNKSVGFDRKEPTISFSASHVEKDPKEPTFAKV